MKKILYIGSGFGVVLLLFVGWWLLSPLFIDKTVNEAFPTESESTTSAESNEEESMEDNMKNENTTDNMDADMGHESDEMKGQDEEDDMQEEDSQPMAMLSGQFKGADQQHNAEGKAEYFEEEGIVRMTDFSATNGPDLYVYMVKKGQDPADGMSLGKLKGNKGNQNYMIPDDITVEEGDQIVIWCKAFSVKFGSAMLQKS
ncbi:DM13 domain-containing protein [Pontibacillus yanchengensis]|uniref:DM13 domain-containing protein n=1 Tax=Pontibacillus yanchengensis Y32 TaxID=1385514 RepID=A0A0A2T9D2_9BACI|nr:DM13 domain-containing protein [Pontibacillus yanchengensis]KGP72392.1 hypothetical protein N782_12085 [Pontibacillus yanchengensis Y32]